MSADNFMSKLTGLDTGLGMTYCGEMEEIYYEVLEEYCGQNLIDVLERTFTEENWKDYAIHAHALKSTSLTIGASTLSEEAKKLELAAKEGRIDEIRTMHTGVLAHYQQVLEHIKAAL